MQFDLVLSMAEEGDTLQGQLIYTTDLFTRETAKRMQARAAELAARVTKGESLDAVAASAGSTVTQSPGIDRQSVQQHTELSQDMLGKLFTSSDHRVKQVTTDRRC